MKKEMVIKVSINNSSNNSNICSCFGRTSDNYCRALQIAVGISGVDSVSFVGDDKSKILVTGDGVDTMKLMEELRKNIGFADLEKLSDVKPPETNEDPPQPVPVEPPRYLVGPPPIPILEEYPQHGVPACCSIM